jgi:hypothetical protein
MICLQESGYTLRQIPGQAVTYVTMPISGQVVKVASGPLTKDAAKKIIISLGK